MKMDGKKDIEAELRKSREQAKNKEEDKKPEQKDNEPRASVYKKKGRKEEYKQRLEVFERIRMKSFSVFFCY